MGHSNYQKVALIYDYLMQGVDYQGWADYIEDINRRLHFKPSRILDLACGTGAGTLALASRGYDVLGLDISGEMLAVAREKSGQTQKPPKFMQQDMRSFTLPRPVDMVVIFQDGLNYLTCRDDVLQTFQRVHEALTPGGIFAFDLHGVKMLPRGFGETHMVEEEKFTLIWQSDYLPEDALWEITLTGFIKNPEGLYQRFQETHREKHYAPEEISFLLEETGFAVEEVFKAFTFERDLTARRLYFVARKRGRGK